ncbi:MAG: 7-carboxy-7-deazaguanine synthase QueE [Planctomycetaceae bacterium]
MRISEVFASIQGEGKWAGTPSAFIRTSGCNLRCWFCDTPGTSWRPRGELREWPSLLDQVASFDCSHVVVTGGEPMLQPEVGPLTRALQERGHVVTIETAGTVFADVQADLVSLSPKLANSTPADPGWSRRHDQARDAPEVIERFIAGYEYQLKFVVDQPGDVVDVDRFIERFSAVTPGRVWLMPQGVTSAEIAERAEWVQEAATSRGWRVSPRLHIELFGNTPGT